MRYPPHDPTMPGKYIAIRPPAPLVAGVKGTYVLTPWGYLEEIRVVFTNPVPNMDASMPHRFDFGFYLGEHYGMSPPMDGEYSLTQLVRNVGNL